MARVPNNKDFINGQNDQPSFRADPITIKQIDELSPAQRQRIDYIMRTICPQGNVFGVMTTRRSWDLRPFVQVPGEPEPSMIRFLGPEIGLVPKLEARIRRVQKHLTALQERQHMSRDQGDLEGQIWYRRKLIDRTFEDLLIERKSFSLDEAIALSVQTAEEIVKFHLLDIYHGHITPQNITIDRNGAITIVDKTIGVSIAQAAIIAANGKYPQEYVLKTFAPELLEGDDLFPESDFYGFGQVFNLIFGLVNTDYFSEEQGRCLGHIKLFLESMTNVSKDKRPSFADYFSLISSINKTKIEEDHKFELNEDKRKPITMGKVVQTKTPEPKTPFNIKGRGGTQLRNERNAQPQMGFKRDNSKPQMAPGFSLKTQDQKKNEQEQKPSKVAEVIHEPENKIEPKNQVKNKEASSVTYSTRPARRPTADFKFIEETDAFIIDDVSYNKSSLESGLDDLKYDSFLSDSKISNSPAVPGRLSNKVLSFILIITAVIFYVLFTGKSNISYDSALDREYSNEELQELWSSGLPSNMTKVVAAAISPNRANAQAERLIVISAKRVKEDILPNFRYDLVRIAFNGMWEAELNPNDRRAALVLASTGLFKDPPNEGLIHDKLHPGILFAITAVLGKESAAAAFLSQTSAKEFERLPAPISSAFVALNATYPNLSCLDERVRLLTQIINGGSNNAQLVSKFIQEDPVTKLQALAQAFSRSPDESRAILGIVLGHPNFQLKDANSDWARKFELSRWPELDANDQLLLLAGIPPHKELEPASIGKMFAHPSPGVRAAAVAKAIDTIRFSHPGAIEVLNILAASPELLDANQTFRLAQFLESPALTNNKAVRESVIAWLRTDPKPEILIKMLVASSNSEKATMLDFEISRYVQEKGWRPTVEELRKLVVHPEQLTRLFACSEAFLIPDRKIASEILTKGLKHESDPRLKALIQENLAKLNTK